MAIIFGGRPHFLCRMTAFCATHPSVGSSKAYHCPKIFKHHRNRNGVFPICLIYFHNFPYISSIFVRVPSFSTIHLCGFPKLFPHVSMMDPSQTIQPSPRLPRRASCHLLSSLTALGRGGGWGGRRLIQGSKGTQGTGWSMGFFVVGKPYPNDDTPGIETTPRYRNNTLTNGAKNTVNQPWYSITTVLGKFAICAMMSQKKCHGQNMLYVARSYTPQWESWNPSWWIYNLDLWPSPHNMEYNPIQLGDLQPLSQPDWRVSLQPGTEQPTLKLPEVCLSCGDSTPDNFYLCQTHRFLWETYYFFVFQMIFCRNHGNGT